jgi:AraC-like DNA-binding protein
MLGATQGVLLLLLISFRYRHHENLPLALFILALSLRLGTIPSWSQATLLAHPWLLPLTGSLPFLFGPLMWWAVRELATAHREPAGISPLHFLPYAAETVLFGLLFAGMSTTEYQAFVARIFAGNPPWWMPARNMLKLASGAIYTALAARVAFTPLSAHCGRMARMRRLWLQTLVVAPVGSLVAFGVIAVRPDASAMLAAGDVTPFLILAAAMVAIVYAVSVLVMTAPEVLARQSAHAAAPAVIEARTHPHPVVDPEECEELMGRLEQLLADGLFRNPELSLRDLAETLDVHPNRLSFAVNHAYGEPFRRFVNRRRLAYFVERVRTGALAQQNILELAFEAGFPSKSTFNRVFKEELGIAPSSYAADVHMEADVLPLDAAGLATRPDPSTMRSNGTSTDRSLQRYPDQTVAGHATGNGRGGSRRRAAP